MKQIYLNEAGDQIVGVSREGEGLSQKQMDAAEVAADLATNLD